MTQKRFVASSLAIVLLAATAAPISSAGEGTIDKSNWRQAEGLIPHPALEWVKNGDLTIRLGKLEFDPAQTQTPWALESLQENIGRFGLNDKNEIVEATSGNRPKFIKGFPFPGVEAADPKAAIKVMYNGYYARNNNGPLRTVMFLRFVTRGGHERDIVARWYSTPLDGWGPAANAENPDDIETYSQIVVDAPYDIAGTAMMDWRYRSAKQSLLLAYVPAIRRVRRMSPANRSDAMFGSDFARDDGGYVGYDGKIMDFDWKLLGTKEVLAPFLGLKPLRCVQNADGEWVPDPQGKTLVAFAYQDATSKEAPWQITSAVWVNRPVWVIEGKSLDPYYNYGRQVIYVDREVYTYYWKEIYDRSNAFWKLAWSAWYYLQSDDKRMSFNTVCLSVMLDERIQHATFIDSIGDTFPYVCNAKINPEQYSLAGFQKLCK